MAKSFTSGSKYHSLPTTRDPITHKPWTATDKQAVTQLNTLAKSFAVAVKNGDTEGAQVILQNRDNIIESASEDVQMAYIAAGLAGMTAALADPSFDPELD